jgi:hypothetical protein
MSSLAVATERQVRSSVVLPEAWRGTHWPATVGKNVGKPGYCDLTSRMFLSARKDAP